MFKILHVLKLRTSKGGRPRNREENSKKGEENNFFYLRKKTKKKRGRKEERDKGDIRGGFTRRCHMQDAHTWEDVDTPKPGCLHVGTNSRSHCNRLAGQTAV